MLDAEALQGGVAGGADVRRAAVDAEPGAVGQALVAELGGELDLVAAPGDGRADQALVGERAVHVGGVEERDAEVEGAVDGRDAGRLVGGAVELGHAHAAEAEGRDGERGRGAERAAVDGHGSSVTPAGRARSPGVRRTRERRGSGGRDGGAVVLGAGERPPDVRRLRVVVGPHGDRGGPVVRVVLRLVAEPAPGSRSHHARVLALMPLQHGVAGGRRAEGGLDHPHAVVGGEPRGEVARGLWARAGRSRSGSSRRRSSSGRRTGSSAPPPRPCATP